ncbi:MAG: response regulator transcription factor [Tissierellales bacterium]|nr:response regulator transcription factor [Tissierellales bacterium]
MPLKNGFETYEEIKDITDAPVLFLTAQKEAKHELKGLNLGAYDYITKPFNYDILSARIRNCIKQVSQDADESIEIGRLRIEPAIRKVFLDNKEVPLTNKEYTLLNVLMINKKNIISRDQLLDKVWGFDYDGNQRTVDVHIQTLRSKLECYGGLIKTVRGVGYYFELDENSIN